MEIMMHIVHMLQGASTIVGRAESLFEFGTNNSVCPDTLQSGRLWLLTRMHSWIVHIPHFQFNCNALLAIATLQMKHDYWKARKARKRSQVALAVHGFDFVAVFAVIVNVSVSDAMEVDCSMQSLLHRIRLRRRPSHEQGADKLIYLCATS